MNFGRNIPTKICGLRPEVIPNIPVRRNQNEPFHLNSDWKFRNLWHNGKHPWTPRRNKWFEISGVPREQDTGDWKSYIQGKMIWVWDIKDFKKTEFEILRLYHGLHQPGVLLKKLLGPWKLLEIKWFSPWKLLEFEEAVIDFYEKVLDDSIQQNKIILTSKVWKDCFKI